MEVKREDSQSRATGHMGARYQLAQDILDGVLCKSIALNTTVHPIWIGTTDCFWYERELHDGKEYRLVDAGRAQNGVAFDHHVLAAALEEASNLEVKAGKLPITGVDMSLDSVTNRISTLRFSAFDRQWEFDTKSRALISKEPIPGHWIVSPNGKLVTFVRDFNLWIRDLHSGDEVQLTFDGEEFNVYGGTGTAWGGVPGEIAETQACWSPDSRKVFTVQRDTRRVLTVPIVYHVPPDGSVRPQLEEVKIAYPGDTHIEELRLLIADVTTKEVRSIDYPQIPVTRNSTGFFGSRLGWWAADSRRAYFVEVERDYKTARVIEINSETGATKILFEENSDTHINLMLGGDDYPTLLPIADTNELLWFSERSGWGHIYLYDLDTGELKNVVTSGDWVVRSVAHFEPIRREVFLQTAGRVKEIDPYYRDLVRVNVDSGELTMIAANDADNVTVVQTDVNTLLAGMTGDVGKSRGIQFGGDYAVVTRTRADSAPISFLADRDGAEIMEIETADTSLLPDGWRWPEPVTLLAADGRTHIYGLVFRPTDFSPDRSYAVICHTFNNPEVPWVSKGSFTNGAMGSFPYLDAAALAEVGFIVVQIDGRGSALRCKAFQDECYGSFQAASSIDDHVAGIRQLADRYPYMDLGRVGITAHPSGGSGCVEGMLRYPEFFKVGVCSYLHDRRMMSAAMMANKYEGLSAPREDNKYPEQLAENLEGRLLIIQGMLDWCTTPAAAFRLVDALQLANKDFDMLFLPNFGRELPDKYVFRRVWKYFAEHLLGE